MNKTIKAFRFMSLLASVCFLVLVFGQTAIAQVVTFAQFLERNGTQDYVFTNNTTSGTFSTVPGGSPIFFVYQNVSGLPAELQGFQNAHLLVTTTTSTPATLSGSNLTQPLDAVSTIQIIRDMPASPGTGGGSRTNLVTATFSSAAGDPNLSGSNGGNSATLSAATPSNNVVFTSDFLGFGLTTQRDLALSFSSVLTSFTSGAGGFLESFTAAGTGTYSSNPAPGYFPPTTAGVSVRGMVTNLFGSAIPRAVVMMVEPNGNRRQLVTNHFGYFSFADLTAGETYIFEVRAKGHVFTPQVVNVDENIGDLIFRPDFFGKF
ncbi:MAG: carboxypeptidase regulatory-like domain-containing protein [Pyrinomonadaceae bacterium]|nr:carboxypeptidase regulatory-like domain-containing protein [Pyrinomonadaceae bacterium]